MIIYLISISLKIIFKKLQIFIKKNTNLMINCFFLNQTTFTCRDTKIHLLQFNLSSPICLNYPFTTDKTQVIVQLISTCIFPFLESIRWYFWLMRPLCTTSVRFTCTYPNDSCIHKNLLSLTNNIIISISQIPNFISNLILTIRLIHKSLLNKKMFQQ